VVAAAVAAAGKPHPCLPPLSGASHQQPSHFAGCAVQAVDYAALRARLEADGQVRARGVDAESIEGLVVDDTETALTGEWEHSMSITPSVGGSYRHHGDTRGGKEARYEALVPSPGEYEVRLLYQRFLTAPSTRRCASPRLSV